ncbi:reverse transcriptase domain-containing protein [Tanacetum coccineum]
MPLSIWKELSLPALTKTRMILELADRTISTPTGIAKDVFVKVGTFFFPADFVVVDYISDLGLPLILGRPFLRMARALIDVHGEQMTLRHDDQSVTFKVGDTKTLSYNIIETVNRVDVIDNACENCSEFNIKEELNPKFMRLLDEVIKLLMPLAGKNEDYCFLDGIFYGYFKIPIDHLIMRRLPYLPLRDFCLSEVAAFWVMQCTRHVPKVLYGCNLSRFLIEGKPWKSSWLDFSVFGDSFPFAFPI